MTRRLTDRDSAPWTSRVSRPDAGTRVSDAPALPHHLDVLTLVRRFEPVLRFTSGELFFPMPVDDYLASAALWASGPSGRGGATRLLDHGQLDAYRLAAEA